MVVLDVDHPDIREFIWCKANEEDKAAALRDAGFDLSIDGDGFEPIQYQNANNSVRVTDEFMRAVARRRVIGNCSRGRPANQSAGGYRARELMREIAEAAWRCADPGVQYDTTMNQWRTSPNSGHMNASDPCFPLAVARVHTTQGPDADRRALTSASTQARRIDVYTSRATAGENGADPRAKGSGVVATRPLRVEAHGRSVRS